MKPLKRTKSPRPNAAETLNIFEAFEHAALADGLIPKKYKELMALAVALATESTYLLDLHQAAALRAGATEGELTETIFVAAALRAGATMTHGSEILGQRPGEPAKTTTPSRAGIFPVAS